MFQVYHSHDWKNTGIRDQISSDLLWWTAPRGRTGGYTIVYSLEDPYMGVAICSPKDQFSKKQGRLIAEDRAIELAAQYPLDWIEESGGDLVFIKVPEIRGNARKILLWRAAVTDAIRLATEHHLGCEYRVVF